ncbi:hypothetical protein ACVRZC_02600 [Streptococcus hyointestinalis]|uniref:Uncharacterized protein n=1 Tax=Streptococcus hyointestinalis TaxID=1337 RepID=A0A380K1X5_9STRE|nr:hypothetical protein [Streptococcus hyointestinalis]SUN58022.1 Uncharacterised protein [Streptococcus hyointestinalis]
MALLVKTSTKAMTKEQEAQLDKWSEQLTDMLSTDFEIFVKALVKVDLGISDEEALANIFNDWFNDTNSNSILADTIVESAEINR